MRPFLFFNITFTLCLLVSASCSNDTLGPPPILDAGVDQGEDAAVGTLQWVVTAGGDS
jgi:hypothetical protein